MENSKLPFLGFSLPLKVLNSAAMILRCDYELCVLCNPCDLFIKR